MTVAMNVLLVAAAAVLSCGTAAAKPTFTCESIACEQNFKVYDQDHQIAVRVNKGLDAGGTVARVSGPGILFMRHVRETCDCSINIKEMGLNIPCSHATGKSIMIEDGGATLEFVRNDAESCFNLWLEITPPIHELANLLAMKMGMNQQTVHDIESAAKSDASVRAVAGLTPSPPVECDYAMQLEVIHELPHGSHNREAQLLLSNLRRIFKADFEMGMSSFGGRSGCFNEIVPMDRFETNQKPFLAAMKMGDGADEKSPRDSPLAALHRATESKFWPQREQKEVLRVVLLDASSPPHDHSGSDCKTTNEAKLVQDLTKAGIAVVFFVTDETEEMYEDLRNRLGLDCHIHKLVQGRMMLSINTLTRRLEDNLRQVCKGRPTASRRLFALKGKSEL